MARHGEDALAAAGRLRDAGRLSEAEKLYRRILAANPSHIGALQSVGAIAGKRGEHKAAETWMRRALALAPNHAETHNNLGAAIAAQGRVEEALASFERAVALRPEFPDAYFNIGKALCAQGRLQEAVASLERALALKPDHVDAQINLGLALEGQGRADQAIARYGRALELRPDRSEAHFRLGMALQGQGRFEEAAASFERTLALEPNSTRAHLNLGNAMHRLGRLDEAVASFERVLALDPGHAIAHYNIGNVLKDRGRLAEAVASFERALALRPDYAPAHNNLGNVLHEQGRLDEALASYRRALALDPDHVGAHNNLGMVLQAQGRLDEAMASLERAIALKPDHPGAHFNLGLALLLHGDFERGTAEYEWRWQAKDHAPRLPSIDVPAWDGRPLPGQTLLLRAEQGLGDAIQFVRHAPLVRARCGRVVLQCPAALVRLLATVAGVDEVTASAEPPPGIAAHAPLLSLMHLLGTRLETIPAEVPYLAANPRRVAEFQEQVAAAAGLKVGLVWAGSPIHKNDRNRSLGLAALAPLLAIEGVSFFSLQKGAAAEEVAASGLAGRLIDLGPELGDFADTAAAVSCLDLVIAVDTAVAHLAGALGKPVWTLLPFAPDWRWMVDRADSPWYPTMRLYRQPALDDWAGVLEKVAADLLRQVRQRASSRDHPPTAASTWQAEAFAEAMRYHRAGRDDEAEQLFRRILATDPRHVRALYYLGIAAARRGKYEAAEQLFGRALALAPAYADAHYNLGNVLQAQGRLEAAVASYRRAVALEPNAIGAHMGLGNTLLAQHRLEEAAATFGRAIALAPARADAHFRLGDALQAQGRLKAAAESYCRVLAIEPDHAEAHNNIGTAFAAQGCVGEAIASFQRALALKPDYADAQNNLGTALSEQGQLSEAVACYQHAVALRPDFVPALSNLANALRQVNRTDEAKTCLERAISLQPDYAPAHNIFGVILQAQGRLEAALASYRRALAAKPNHAGAHFNLSMALLLQGDFERGAAEYEWRWQAKGVSRLPSLDAAAWDGRPVPGQTVLLRAEQGLGDAIQFVRYAPLVRARCGRVVLQCHASLVRLLATAPGIDEVTASAEPPQGIAAHAPLLSLMHLLGTRLETIPAEIPYLAANPVRAAAFQERIGAAGGLKVGLVWAGSPIHKNDRDRSLGLAALASLLAVEGVSFFSLQKGAAAEEIAASALAGRLIDLGPELGDFADTAAAVSGLDLVISVDTAVAHLAGALGKPAWTLLPFVPDWRWLLDRADSPWYPTMRLYRQPALGDWASVLQKVAADLLRQAQQQAPVRDHLPSAASTWQAEAFAEAMRHHRAGRDDEAEKLFRRVFTSDPGHVRALYYLGIAAARRGEYEAAEQLFGRALALAPAYADAHYNLGNVLQAQGRLEAAVASYRRAIALEPNAVEAHLALGKALMAQSRLEEAAASFARAIALAPDRADAHFRLGDALQAQGQLEEAVASYRHAIALEPNHVGAHIILGNALQTQGRLEEATASFERALALEPDHAGAHYNLGNVLRLQGRIAEAVASFERALAVKPDYGEAHVNLGMNLLLNGDIERGAAEYEWRWRAEGWPCRLPSIDIHAWDGRPMPGQTLLLRAEQGLGDTIQFVRYAPLVRERCGRVVLQCHASLVRLLATAPGIDELTASANPPQGIAAHAPLLSLMHLLGTRLETIPAEVPYLAANPTRVAVFQERISAAGGLKVGLVWAGSPIHKNDRNRSLGLTALAPLLAVEGVSFFSLQKGVAAEEIAASALAGRLIDLGPELSDFADTAAAVSCLDLVIAADTAVVHLAGALGRPVWTLLPFVPDWRWLLDRADSPWYPTMRLYRQPTTGDWASVINAVTAALRQIVRDRSRLFALAQPEGRPGRPTQTNADALVQAERHHEAGRLAEAEALYRLVLNASPDHVNALQALGVIVAERGEYPAAETWFGRAVALAPNRADAHYNIGKVYQSQDRLEAAEASYRQALAIKPDFVEALNNLGLALYSQGRHEAAAETFRETLAIKPDHFTAVNNLGLTLYAQGRDEAAAESYRKALVLRPDYAEAHVNLGIALLRQGNFVRGAPEYEWRWQAEGFPRLPPIEAPAWDGQTVPGKALLLRAEQGFGDAIQFVRYAPLVRERCGCGRVVLQCPAPLARLLTTVSGVDEVIVNGAPLPVAAAHAPLLSLMRLLGTRLETIPAAVPYLAANQARVAAFQDRIGVAAGLKVGLVWAGRPNHRNDRSRSLGLAALAPLLAVEGVSFFSLQKGVAAAEIAASGFAARLIDLGPELGDFADTAAAVSCLNLVISVDTAVAHLAGALGKPVWTLLPFAPDWRWLIDRADSPWYPTMRLYRQPAPGDWASVLQKVAAELSDQTKNSVASALRPTRNHAEAEPRTSLAPNRLDEAVTGHARALGHEPNAAKTRAARTSKADGRLAIAIRRDDAEAYYHLGNSLQVQGRLEEAIASYEQAIALKPSYVEAHVNFGNALQVQGRLDDAVACYGRALSFALDYAIAHYNLGNVLQAQARFVEAVASYNRAIALQPSHAEAHLNLGNALQAQGRLDEAVASFERVLAIEPEHAGAHYNIGNARKAQGRLDDAVASYKRALMLKPDFAESYCNLGNALQSLGRMDEAVASLERAIALKPDYAGCHFSLGLAVLLKGDFKRGTAEYEWRWRMADFPRLPSIDIPAWDGRPVPGQTVLLRAEQGLGDAIQFVRYAPLVRARCGRVVLQCPAALLRLLATAPGIDEVTASAEPPQGIAAHAPLLSLMHLLGTRLETIPAEVPYLAANRVRTAAFQERIGAAGGLKVGLVWAGSPIHKNDRNRSLGLAALAPLLAVEGVSFFSLQKGAADAEIAASGFAARLIDLGPELSDFADAAAAVSCLDLVISVDTAVAHLAGALGKPVWTLLPFAPDWRWMLGRADSPWYPTMRLYRQPALGDWASVLQKAAADLLHHAQQQAPVRGHLPTAASTLQAEAFAEAMRHHRAGRFEEAITHYRRALARKPDDATSHVNLGAALAAQGQVEEAVTSFKRALALKPDYVEAHVNLGVALAAQNRVQEAVESYKRALAIKPHFAEAHFNLGNALQAQNQFDEAVESYRRALHLKPDLVEARNNLGTALQAQGSLEEAAACYRMVLALRPDYAEAHVNLGVACQHQRRLGEAVASFERALAVKPDSGEAHVNLSMNLLLNGDIERGAAEYEWRWRVEGWPCVLPNIDVPAWDGRPVPGQTLLLRAEQGLGDTIQFVRYAPLVRARCGRVVLQCHASLVRLFTTAPGIDEVAAPGQPLPVIAAHAPLLSLMHLLGTRLETIPAEVPYLAASPRRVAEFRERIGAAGAVKVGLVWAGSPTHKNDRNRSLGLAALAPLLAVEGVSFFSLQKGAAAEEVAASGLAGRLSDLGPELGDFADTAAAVSCLDLVIAVDTAVAHLAGALGKPVWTLLPFAPDWRWLLDRADSPWYPTMRLYRQPAAGDWASVLERVAADLSGEARQQACRSQAFAPGRLVFGTRGELLAEAVRQHRAGRLDEAITSYRGALALNSNDATIHANLGAALASRGLVEEAIASFERALAIKPDFVEACVNLGVALAAQNRSQEAAESFQRALAIKPNFAAAHCNLGNVLQAQDRLEEAIASYQRALVLKPDLVEAHTNLGNALQAQGRPQEAATSYGRALAFEPNSAVAHNNLGTALKAQGQLEEAVESFRRAITLRPDFAEAHNNLGTVLTDQARPTEAKASYRQALALKPDFVAAHTNLIFALNFDLAAGPEEQCQERVRWYEQHGRRFAAAISRHANSPDPERRLRVGYVSGHFRRYPPTYAFAPVLLNHDAERFEVTCYSDTVRADDLTRALRARVERWRDTFGWSDDRLAETIRADGIDILVDLVGHMLGNRLLVFARKPAPIQVTGWGEPTGTGLPTMDYLLADPVLVPPEHRALLAEEVVDLPGFLGYWTPDSLPELGPLPALASGQVTFGSFNRMAKISDAVLRCWAAILRALPSARLVLKTPGLGESGQQARVRAVLSAERIAPERLTLLGMSDRMAHFVAYQMVDVALDPFPHGGGMTTLDALWMGVPVVTAPGSTISSRIAAASLTALGLTDFIAPERTAYIALAVAKAGDLGALARLRQELRGRLARSAIGDPVRYVGSVETAYRAMWRRWCAGHGSESRIPALPAGSPVRRPVSGDVPSSLAGMESKDDIKLSSGVRAGAREYRSAGKSRLDILGEQQVPNAAASSELRQVSLTRKPTVMFDWGVSSYFGWGIIGLNLMLNWARRPDLSVCCLMPINPNDLALNPLERAIIDPALRQSREAWNRLRGAGKVRVPYVVLHGLGNNLSASSGAKSGMSVFGTPSIGVPVFESTRFDNDVRERASIYPVVVAASTWNRDVLVDLGIGPVEVILQGVDTTHFHPGPRKGLFADRFVVFSGGKLEWRKGQDLVITAFRIFAQRHADALLATAWNSPWPKLAQSLNANRTLQPIPFTRDGQVDVLAWTQANGISRRQMLNLGSVPNAEMPRILREVDVALFPNRAEGATNLVAMECMACGTPTILSCNTGHRDLIGGENCYALERQKAILHPGCQGWGESDVDEIVEALETVYQNRAEAQRRGSRGAEMMGERTWAQYLDKLAALIRPYLN